ncbi:TetR family transcriptional regulator [Pimelobacter simplex]|uniref:TetR family transcriptional regulator n=1 Tax=Nocardioides simplex TaxID=2045 RepID=UPI001932FDF3|nr:TetR family transcriptional regulator [Pimelobacter simplex]
MQDYTPAQQRVLDAAAAAFSEHGFGGTSTRDIAVRAGRSPAAVYVHYSSKEDLLFAVSRRGHEAALRAMLDARDTATCPHDRLTAMVHASTLWHLENALLARVVQHEFGALTEPHRSTIAALRRETSQLVVDAIEDGNASGDFDVADHDVTGTARALLSLAIDLVRWFSPDHLDRAEGIANLNVRLAERMVGSRHRPPPRSPSTGR